MLCLSEFAADDCGTFGERLELGEGKIARDVFHAPIRRRDQPLERHADAGGDGLRRLRFGVAHADHAKDHGLVAEPVGGPEGEFGLGGFVRDLLMRAVLAQDSTLSHEGTRRAGFLETVGATLWAPVGKFYSLIRDGNVSCLLSMVLCSG